MSIDSLKPLLDADGYLNDLQKESTYIVGKVLSNYLDYETGAVRVRALVLASLPKTTPKEDLLVKFYDICNKVATNSLVLPQEGSQYDIDIEFIDYALNMPKEGSCFIAQPPIRMSIENQKRIVFSKALAVESFTDAAMRQPDIKLPSSSHHDAQTNSGITLRAPNKPALNELPRVPITPIIGNDINAALIPPRSEKPAQLGRPGLEALSRKPPKLTIGSETGTASSKAGSSNGWPIPAGRQSRNTDKLSVSKNIVGTPSAQFGSAKPGWPFPLVDLTRRLNKPATDKDADTPYDQAESRGTTYEDMVTENTPVPIPLAPLYNTETVGDILRIGYTDIIVPINAINVREENGMNVVELLRSAGSIKEMSGKANLIVDISFTVPDLPTFNKLVIPLLNQFRRTAFLPVLNEYLFCSWGIDAIALKEFSISTTETPGVFTVQLVCEPFAWFMHLHGADTFSESFCWPLFYLWCETRSTCVPLIDLDARVQFDVPNKAMLMERAEQLKRANKRGVGSAAVTKDLSAIQDWLQQQITNKNTEQTFILDGISDYRVASVLIKAYLDGKPYVDITYGKQGIRLSKAVFNHLYSRINAYLQSVDDAILAETITLEEDTSKNTNPSQPVFHDMPRISTVEEVVKLLYVTMTYEPKIIDELSTAINIIEPPKILDDLTTFYDRYFFSEEMVLSSVSYGFSTQLAEIHADTYPLPVHQYLGRGDGTLHLQGVVYGSSAVERLRRMYEAVRELGFIDFSSWAIEPCAYVRIKNDVLNALGVEKILPITLQISNMPNYPETFTFQIDALEYNDTQRRKEDIVRMEEELNKKLAKLDGTTEPGSLTNDPSLKALIESTRESGQSKIVRIAYINRMLKIRDLYPDMRLPSKAEVGEWIRGIKNYVSGGGTSSKLIADSLSICALDNDIRKDIMSMKSVPVDTLGWEDADFYCIPPVKLHNERAALLDNLLGDNPASKLVLRDQFNAKLVMQAGDHPELAMQKMSAGDRAALEKEIAELKRVTARNFGDYTTQLIETNMRPEDARKDVKAYTGLEVIDDAKKKVDQLITARDKQQAAAAADYTYRQLIDKVVYDLYSRKRISTKDVDKSLIIAMIAIESGFNTRSYGANNGDPVYGLLQLTKSQTEAMRNTGILVDVAALYNVDYVHGKTTDTRTQLYMGIYQLSQIRGFFDSNEVKRRVEVVLRHHRGDHGRDVLLRKRGLIPASQSGALSLRYAELVLAIARALDKRNADFLQSQIATAVAVGQGGAPDAASKAVSNAIDNTKTKFYGEYTTSSEELINVDKINVNYRDLFHDFEYREDSGRLATAFPTFFVCIMDEGRWLGIERLWDHFYGQFGISSIDITQSRKTPVDVATVTFSNMYGRLTSITKHIQHLKETDTRQTMAFGAFLRGMQQVFSGVATEDLRRRWDRYLNTLMLEPGCRLHIRLGYHNDATKLPIKFNGVIAEVPLSAEYVQVIALGDGIEMAKPMDPSTPGTKQGRPDEGTIFTNTNFLNSPKEPQQIIGEFWRPKNNLIANLSHGKWLNDNQFGLVHFGSVDYSYNNGILTHALGEVGVNIYTSRISSDPEREYSALNNWATMFIFPAQTIYALQGYTLFGVYQTNATVWDVVETCRKAVPDYIAAVRPFGFRSTLFYGKYDYPFYYEYKEDTALGDITKGMSEYAALGKAATELKDIEISQARSTVLGYIGAVCPAIGYPLLLYRQEKALLESSSRSAFERAMIGAIGAVVPGIGLPLFWYEEGKAFLEKINKDKSKPQIQDLAAFDVTEYFAHMNHKSFCQAHVISSYINLVGGAITATDADVFNNCMAKYAYGLFGTGIHESDLMHADSDIFPEFQRTKVIQSGVLSGPLHGMEGVQNIPSKIPIINSIFPFKGVKAAANTTAAMHIRDDLADMYQGAHVVFGDPYINAWDFCYVSDRRSKLNGVYQAKEVVNSFSMESGYLTSISPDCIVYLAGSKQASIVGGIYQILGLYTSYKALHWTVLQFIKYSNRLNGMLFRKLAGLRGRLFNKSRGSGKIKFTYNRAPGANKRTSLEVINNRGTAPGASSAGAAKAETAPGAGSAGAANAETAPGVSSVDAAAAKRERYAAMLQDRITLMREAQANRLQEREKILAELAKLRSSAAATNIDEEKKLLSRLNALNAELEIGDNECSASEIALEKLLGRSTNTADERIVVQVVQKKPAYTKPTIRVKQQFVLTPSSVGESAEAATSVEETIVSTEKLLPGSSWRRRLRIPGRSGIGAERAIEAAAASARRALPPGEGAIAVQRLGRLSRARLALPPGPAEVIAAEAAAGPPGWLALAAEAGLMIIAGTLGDVVGRWLSARQSVCIIPLTVNGMEFSAGINGHAGAVRGDRSGWLDDVLAKIFSMEYATKKNGTLGAIVPFLVGFLLPGSDQGFDPEIASEDTGGLFDDNAFGQYIRNLEDASMDVIRQAMPPTSAMPTVTANGNYTSRSTRSGKPVIMANSREVEQQAQKLAQLSPSKHAGIVRALNGVDRNFANRILALIADAKENYNIPLSISSGYRSNAKQAAMYREYQDALRHNRPHAVVAAPGSSWHEFGAAVDLAIDSGYSKAQYPNVAQMHAIIHAIAGKYGICFPVRSEWWHAQPVETCMKG